MAGNHPSLSLQDLGHELVTAVTRPGFIKGISFRPGLDAAVTIPWVDRRQS